jgi:hypothetical protein
MIRLGRRLRCDQANGENTARSARAPLKNGAAVGGSWLKITTDVAFADATTFASATYLLMLYADATLYWCYTFAGTTPLLVLHIY